MKTSSLNQTIKDQVSEMFEYIANKKYDDAEAIADILDEKSSGYIDGIAKARVLISRGRRNEKNN